MKYDYVRHNCNVNDVFLNLTQTGVRIQLDRTQDGDVAKIFARTREELEDAKAKVQ